MDQVIESKDVSWQFIQAAQIVEKRPCELIYAKAVANGQNPESYLYHGVNNRGVKILRFVGTKSSDRTFSPRVPVLCEHGIYWGHERHHEGIFIEWRVIPER